MALKQSTQIVLTVLFEGAVSLLLIAALVPEGMAFGEFLKDPLGSMRVDETSIALVFCLLLPLVLPHIKSLKIFGAEIERLERIDKNILKVQKDSLIRFYDHERALFKIASSITMTTPSRVTQSQKIPGKDRPIEIGVRDFTESQILAEIVYILLEGLNVNPPVVQGSLLGNFLRLRSSEVDLNIDYSGNGYMLAGRRVEDHDAATGQAQLNDLYKKWGLTWLDPIGFNNQHELVILKKTAKEHGIQDIRDLAGKSHHLTFSAYREFFIQDTTYFYLKNVFGVRFKNIQEVSIRNRWEGIFSGACDVAVGWTTDANMDDARILRIQYDKPYYAFPVARNEVVPIVRDRLRTLHITENQMRLLNKKAHWGGATPEAIRGVASQFCRGLRRDIRAASPEQIKV